MYYVETISTKIRKIKILTPQQLFLFDQEKIIFFLNEMKLFSNFVTCQFQNSINSIIKPEIFHHKIIHNIEREKLEYILSRLGKKPFFKGT